MADIKQRQAASKVRKSIQTILSTERKKFGISGGQGIKVDSDVTTRGIVVTFEAGSGHVFGNGTWRKITDHFRNGGMEALKPALKGAGLDNPRVKAIAKQHLSSNPLRRSFRIA